MICRFVIILFFVVANGICAPLFAAQQPVGAQTPQRMMQPMPQPMPQPMAQPMAQPIPSATQNWKKTIHNLENTYRDSEKELTALINYVGFGILIAIFFMEVKFRIRNKCRIFLSSFFATLTLLSNYVGNAYLFRRSGNMLRNMNQYEIDRNYSEMSAYSDYIFWAMQGFILVAVILFSFLGYQYFFDKKMAYDLDTMPS